MKKHYVIGLLFILSIVIFFWGINFFKSKNLFSSKNFYYSVYNSIDGLQVSNPVYFQGFQIGNVTDVSILSLTEPEILVELNMKEDVNIPVNSIAEIYSSDIMGSKAIRIIIGDAEDNLNIGDTIISNIEGDFKDEVNKQILPLKLKAEDLIASADSAITVITSILNKDVRESLGESLYSLDNAFNSLDAAIIKLDDIVSSNQENLNKIVSNFESITANINSNEDEINKIFSNISEVSDNINSVDVLNVLQDFKSSIIILNNILAKVDSGDNTFSMLLNDKALYDNLLSSSSSLDSLIIDISNNPKKYINFSLIGVD